MLADLLEQVGIMAQVQGDMLQGAMGELPAAGLASVWVAESDECRAREVIADFEASQPEDAPALPRPESQRSFTRGLLLGMVIGAVVMLVLLR
tara:strand:+ start:536 stop:814 length:279 start_codon:yes stop_codon:yes gene_type:complete